MVRSFAQWTKTLSFPARLSPQKQSQNPEISSDAEKDIMSSVVCCIHNKEGCKWSDQLRKLKAHLNTCKWDTTPCTNLCGAQIPRVLIEDHLRFTCPLRGGIDGGGGTTNTSSLATNNNGVVAGATSSPASQQNHQPCEWCSSSKSCLSCPKEPVHCDLKCGSKLQRRHLTSHQSNDCPKRLVPCRYCGSSFVFETLQAHHSKCTRVPVPCPNRCGLSQLAREELDCHLLQCSSPPLVNCPFREAGCRFKGVRGSTLDRHIDDSTSQHLNLVCSLVTRQQQQISSLKSAINRMATNTTGTLVWKIADYADKMGEAKSKDGMELVSPIWYTSQFGYRLQASLFLNGNGSGEGTHVSLYIKILPGEFDALLKWPFSHSVAFTLFDLSEKACNVVESFVPDPTWENFQRPSKEPDSLGFGFPRFVSHETLLKRNYIKDDTLFIRIKVDPAKIVAV